jgi:hypothetical protein
MQKELETLQDFITNDFAGVVWFSIEPLSEKPPLFSSFDYFFDGLLFKKINTQETSVTNYQTFFTKHFNQDFVLAHLDANNSNWQNDLGKFVDYFKVINTAKRKLAVVNYTTHKVAEYLEKKYSANLISELKI